MIHSESIQYLWKLDSVGHKCLLLVYCSVRVVVVVQSSPVQHTMSTNLLLLYSMFGLSGTGGEGDPLWGRPH